MNNQNQQLIAVSLILFSFCGIIFIPIFLINNNIFTVVNQYSFFFIFFIGFIFLIVLMCLLALKQRKNIWG